MTRSRPGRQRSRGTIDELPSGALRVRVYAGKDPVTGRRRDLVELIPPGPKAGRSAEAARTRLLNQVDEQRQPRTNATVNQLLDQHFELSTWERQHPRDLRRLCDQAHPAADRSHPGRRPQRAHVRLVPRRAPPLP